MACHVYESQYYKMLIIACCDMQFEDGATQTLFWKKLNVVIADNGVPKVHFKGFMADSAHASWDTARMIYGDGDPSLPMVVVGKHGTPTSTYKRLVKKFRSPNNVDYDFWFCLVTSNVV